MLSVAKLEEATVWLTAYSAPSRTPIDVEEPVGAVTTGSVRRELRPVGALASVSGRQLDPSAGDLAVTAGWGHGGRGGVTMPGRGRAVERPLLGRDLRPDEARYVTEMTRRIAAILLLEPALDENYERVKADIYAWPSSAARSA